MNTVTKRILEYIPFKKSFASYPSVEYTVNSMTVNGMIVMEIMREGNAKHTAGGYTTAGYFIEEGQVFKSIKQLVEYYN